LWSINLDSERKVKAEYFKINKRGERSSHFLNFEPVISFIHENEIGVVKTEYTFFIANVFKFYKAMDPSISHYENTMKIDYDFDTKGTGFIMEIDSLNDTDSK
jgi:hypothetical protein